MMLLNIVLLLGSLVLLTIGADGLVRGGVAVGRVLDVPPLFIGLVLLGFGTSLPELATSVTATLQDADAIAVGNVVGSNILNIALILGLTALIQPIAVERRLVRRDALIMLAVAFVPFAAWFTGGGLGLAAGVFMLAGLLGFIGWGYVVGRAEGAGAPAVEADLPAAPHRPLLAIGMAVIGLILLGAGSWLLVRSAVALAQAAGVSQLVIGLTIVGAGTSAPELVTSLAAALRRQPELSLGNILGSNVFNILGILGVTCIIRPQLFSPQTLMLDLPVMLAATAGATAVLLTRPRMSRVTGAAFLAGYLVYLALLFTVGPSWFTAH